MSEALKYDMVFERSADGLGAFLQAHPGCISVGGTLEETEDNIREAITGHIAVMREFGEAVPSPTSFAKNVEIPAAVGF